VLSFDDCQCADFVMVVGCLHCLPSIPDSNSVKESFGLKRVEGLIARYSVEGNLLT